MRRRTIGFVLAAVLLAAGTGAGQKRQQEIDLQAAIRTETVNGDLKAAIMQYDAIVAKYKDDRSIAATALIRMADCYRKQGDAESRKIYERVLREYPDQKEAVSVARARLGLDGSVQQAGAMSSRQVWTLPPGAVIDGGTVSHDGRYLPYTYWAVPGGKGELFLHDIAAGTNRQVTNEVTEFGREYAQEATFSPDDNQLAYAWFNKDRFELRIIGLQAAGPSHPRVVFSNPEVPRISPGDWSPDGKWLAVQLVRKDKTTQIGLVAAKEGSLRVLKSVETRGTSNLFFSPDSAYLAYDFPASDTDTRSDVFVLATDGSREIPVVVHPANDVLMGWSPAGKRLLFSSNRTGYTGLWALAFADGKPQGAPEQIKLDVTGDSMGLTSAGVLYSLARHSNFNGMLSSDIQAAAFDFVKGQFLSTPALAVETFVGANSFPAWSPDGKSLAFVSHRGRMTYATVIASPDTGQLRELQSGLRVWASAMQWSPDGRSLAAPAVDAKEHQGIFRIDGTTGAATPIALSSFGPAGGGEYFEHPAWAPDGKSIYYSRYNQKMALTAIVERDLTSGNEKEVIRGSGRMALWDLSPNGKYLAIVEWDFFPGPPALPARTGKWRVLLTPASGGETRELMHGESQEAGVLMWAPDSRSIFIHSLKDRSTLEHEVWRIAIDGTKPQRLDLNVNFLGPLCCSDQRLLPHPDGKRVAFAAVGPTKSDQVWALENFLPPSGKGK